MSSVRSKIRRFFPGFIQRAYGNFQGRRELSAWRASGSPVPPPHFYKKRLVISFAEKFQLKNLVETGTYRGDMIEACRTRFKKIYSIEIDAELWRQANERFVKYPHVNILQGDSAEVLPQILQKIEGPCVFWLDGHYSGGVTGKGERETPIVSELGHIRRQNQPDVILIDDARLFNGTHDYPDINELRAKVLELWPENVFEVSDDVIRIYPRVGAR